LSRTGPGYARRTGDHERSATVDAEPGILFDHLSDVQKLPHYFAAMRSAAPAGGDEIHTVADVEGTKREGDAWFTAEESARTIRCAGSQGTVRLHTSHTDGPDIDGGPDETPATIRRNVEQVVDPAAP
jgi:hypothetical protein